MMLAEDMIINIGNAKRPDVVMGRQASTINFLICKVRKLDEQMALVLSRANIL